jgi:site-specific recombinase XerD
MSLPHSVTQVFGITEKHAGSQRTERMTNSILKVNEWQSEYLSINELLKHLARRSKSESSRQTYLRHISSFTIYTGKNPDELINLKKKQAEIVVQRYTDSLRQNNLSIRSINTKQNILKTFFKVNGFKGNKTLEIESHYMPSRYRKMPEYIPTKNEIYRMSECARSLRDKAIILTLYSSGLRNSTLRAILYENIEKELSLGYSNLLLNVFPEMKSIDPNACKNNIPYYTFACDEATESIKLYLIERSEKYGRIRMQDPLFPSEYNQIGRLERQQKVLTARELQIVIKESAKRSGIKQWQNVSPRTLRKAFESILHSDLIDGGHLDVKVQEFLMGHILPGTQDPYFDKTKAEEIRCLYSRLKFGRARIENKFKILKEAVTKAFEGTDIDVEKLMKEYIKSFEQCRNIGK